MTPTSCSTWNSLPFPEGYAASVHFAWPSSPYIPLGILTNQKPSAIFRLRPHLPAGITPGSGAAGPANLGIEIAPLAQIEGLGIGAASTSEGAGKEVAAKVDVGKVAEKVVKNLFNYLHSFGGEVKLTPETPIPLSVFQQWYDNFTRKIENDRGASFLDRQD
ncbi:uncharacterized protein MKK02DRAFT_40527 [Dioszegia hungarica]|uniref:Hikeshi-like domain-containing protein n=1 Tax=Dioszegia hungarica TaxID=4972 RepID=A0AA38H1X2_9TREE|nr:uncharacterized protein MKK02DRAFT_40527 [Dioszegia hungarica]KAI9632225.1 hypothetical protein MKK02DRAFT_40527 [Dioszegia hungarica]